MVLDALIARSSTGGSRGLPLRVVSIALALVLAWTLATAAAGSPFVPVASAQGGVGLGPAVLPPGVDSDQDSWIDTVEVGLGSDAADDSSQPESISIPLTCWDGLDNDGDGAVDSEDPGCEMIPPLTGVFPDAGSDTFESTIDLAAYELLTPLGVCTVDFSGTGPVVVDRTAVSGGNGVQRTFETEIVSMQLTGTAILLPGSPCNGGSEPTVIEAILIEDPDAASAGTVSSQDTSGAADYPADSFFDVFFEIATPIGLLMGGPPGGPAGDPVQVTNVVNSMPPYNTPANAALNPDCYAVDRAQHVHCPKPPLDNFLCYNGTFPKGGAREVSLSDQFGASRTRVRAADRFCNATRIGDPGLFDRGAHLERFKISGKDDVAVPKRVRVSNRFGLQQILNVGKPVGLFVPSQKNLEDPPAALDHFKCYSVRGSAAGGTVALRDQFIDADASARRARVGRPRTLCNPTTKTHNGIVTPVADPNWHLVCYALQTRGRVNRDIVAKNQFVEESSRLVKPVELCVPSMKIVLPEPPPPLRTNLVFRNRGGSPQCIDSFTVPTKFRFNQDGSISVIEFRGDQVIRQTRVQPGDMRTFYEKNRFFGEFIGGLNDSQGRPRFFSFSGGPNMLPGQNALVRRIGRDHDGFFDAALGLVDGGPPGPLTQVVGPRPPFCLFVGVPRGNDAQLQRLATGLDGDDLIIIGDDGNDDITIDDSTIGDDLSIDPDVGDDEILIDGSGSDDGLSGVGDDLQIDTSGGNDEILIDDVSIDDDVLIDDEETDD